MEYSNSLLHWDRSMQLLHLQKTCMVQETLNETQSAPFSCYLILATLPYLTCETVCCCHLRVPLSLLCTRAVSNLKKVQQRQTYADGGLHKVTQGSEWTTTLSLTHSRSHVFPPHCCRRHDHTRFFSDFISCLRSTIISPTERGRSPFHTSPLRSSTQVSVTDWTTQHVYPTVKCTKQLQIMHVTRTVTAERGPTCACRQRMADSCPCLICVSSLAFREGRVLHKKCGI